MFCTKCGKKLEDNAKFCCFCGEQISISNPAKVSEVTSGADKEKNETSQIIEKSEKVEVQKKSGHGKKYFLAFLAGLVVCFGVSAVIYFAFGRRNWNAQPEQNQVVDEEEKSKEDSRVPNKEESSGEESSATDNPEVNNPEKDDPEKGDPKEDNPEESDLSEEGEGRTEAGEEPTPETAVDDNPEGTDNPEENGTAEEANGEEQNNVPEEANGEDENNAPEELPALSPEAMELKARIVELNSGSFHTQGINIFEENYKPETRDESLKWDRIVMYAVENLANEKKEGYLPINQCDIEKKEFVNAANGNVIDYEIYRNPYSGYVNKIVSIEYMGDHLEITDYYYTNEGKVVFVFVRNSDTYQPTYATPDKQGNRYFFNKDRMVAWRIISESGQYNYVVGKKEYDRQKNEGRKNITLYADLSDEGKRNYDKKETEYLNAAYNTYHTVLNSMGVSMIQGFVYDEDRAALPNANVELFLNGEDAPVYEAVSDGNGFYQIRVPMELHSYSLLIRNNDCETVVIYDVEISYESIGVYQPATYLVKNSNQEYRIPMHFGDALNYAYGSNSEMLPLSYAYVYIRNGLNNRYGQILQTLQADYNGDLIANLKPGMYTLEIVLDGYEVLYYNIVSSMYQYAVNINAIPMLADNEIAIVLTWGSAPADLDSHLFDPNDSSGHIWYGSRNNRYGSSLDVDVTSGYGPETVRILNMTDGLYKYYVADFTDCAAGNTRSKNMSFSDATVNVFMKNGTIYTFHVPTNKEGVIWEVFEIRNQRIIPIQRYYSNIQDKSWWHNAK